MKRENRLEAIINELRASKEPLSGATLANLYQVSRQIIVQDIALLRASNYDIISTNKGYLLIDPPGKYKIFKVYHNIEEIADELYTIVEAGGRVNDVFVIHEIYGEIRAQLWLTSKSDVDNFVTSLAEGKISPLMKLTGEYHFHTVEASSDRVLDLIERKLREKNYLVEV
ncbi:transcription repressor NadR [Acetobacterium bakii]|uniref:DeoR faimly transcriptional regulator n=1 Tax=Acetobacterium bakii TaxID=52689 RepID=A0A0L6U6A3_9FIRM|nr:transcription repressor NadR [Acetobacterium bakii]KNZ43325.1 DeoR faimly transcriptional regulator [Acetobacterium bakii]